MKCSQPDRKFLPVVTLLCCFGDVFQQQAVLVQSKDFWCSQRSLFRKCGQAPAFCDECIATAIPRNLGDELAALLVAE